MFEGLRKSSAPRAASREADTNKKRRSEHSRVCFSAKNGEKESS